MAIQLSCPCKQKFQTDDVNVGRRVRCPECGRELLINTSEPDIKEVSLTLDSIPRRKSGMALASLIFGLLSLVCALFTGLPAIVSGCVGLIEIKNGHGLLRGRSAAIWGVVLGAFGSTVVTTLLTIPVFRAVREVKRCADCVNNLKQIALAMHNFEGEQGSFPPAAITDKAGHPLLSWRVAILPYLGAEEESLFRRFRLNEPWDSPNNRLLLDKMPAIFACPDEPQSTPPTSNYQVVVPGACFTGKRKGVKLSEIFTGTSSALLVSESTKAARMNNLSNCWLETPCFRASTARQL